MIRNRLGRRAQVARRRAGAAIGVSNGAARGSAGPIVVSEPTISGTPYIGEVLQGNRGIWSEGGISFKYQWLLCKAEPANGSAFG